MSNPNPDMSGLRPWKKGHCPNPGGKTREQHRLEKKNAETALRIRERLLDSLEHKIEDLENIDDVLTYVDNTIMKMLKDAEDRGLGAPIQDVRSGDGSMSPPSRIEIVAVDGENTED